MRILKKYLLEFDQVMTFVDERLSSAHQLSKSILKYMSFEKGQFYTLLTEDANLSQLYQFSWQGILPPNPSEKIHIQGLGTFDGRWINSIDRELEEYLFQKMLVNKNLIGIFEDLMSAPLDAHMELFRSDGIHYRNQVYYVVTQKTLSLELIKKCIKQTCAAWHFVAILSELDVRKIVNKKFTIRQMKEACLCVQNLIVGAYDGEGYIFWEKRSKIGK